MSKLRVGVFMGGRSAEKEVSFNSGRTVCDHLDSEKYLIIPLFQHSNGALYILPWRFLHRGKISDFEHRLATQAEKISWDTLKDLIDFIYIAAHGRYAEDGILQGFLEVLQIPYLGSKILSSALSINKTIQKDILKANGIRVATSFTITPQLIDSYKLTIHELCQHLEKQSLIFPLIVKPEAEGSSLGITVVFEKRDLMPALLKAASIDNNKRQAVLIEEYIKGLEFTCIVITDYKTGNLLPLSPTEILPEENSDLFDYDQKYMPGRALKFTPARCNLAILEAIQSTSVKTMQALGMSNLARIDGFVLEDSSIVITDPNTLAGMSPSSFIFRQAAEINMSHTHFINHLIETELSSYAMLAPLQNTLPEESEIIKKRMRIGVLLGGRSHEKEISLESGRNILYKLSPQKYEALPIFVDSQLKLHHINQTLLVRNSTKEIEMGLTPEMSIAWSELSNLVDFIFIGLHGGEGENGAIQGTLEMLDIPYNGSSVLASALCMNKFELNKYLKTKDICVPASILIDHQKWHQDSFSLVEAVQELGNFPFIVKPHDDGCSVLVKKVQDTKQLREAIEKVFADGKKHVLVEECIHGMELTVGVIGNTNIQVLPASCAVSAQDILSIEEKFLPGAGENQTPAPLPTAALELVNITMKNAYIAAHCKGYARIDCFYQSAQESPTNNERVIILEINTLPGLTPATCIFHQAAEVGMNPMNFIDLIIELGFEEHRKLVIPAKDRVELKKQNRSETNKYSADMIA